MGFSAFVIFKNGFCSFAYCPLHASAELSLLSPPTAQKSLLVTFKLSLSVVPPTTQSLGSTMLSAVSLNFPQYQWNIKDHCQSELLRVSRDEPMMNLFLLFWVRLCIPLFCVSSGWPLNKKLLMVQLWDRDAMWVNDCFTLKCWLVYWSQHLLLKISET